MWNEFPPFESYLLLCSLRIILSKPRIAPLLVRSVCDFWHVFVLLFTVPDSWYTVFHCLHCEVQTVLAVGWSCLVCFVCVLVGLGVLFLSGIGLVLVWVWFFFLMYVWFCFYREEEKKFSRFACLHFPFCPCQSGIHSARLKAGIYFKSWAYGFRYWGFWVEVLFFFWQNR